MTEAGDMCYNRKTDASGKEEVQMRKRGAYAVLAGAALFMACTLSFTAFAKEERTPVGKIKLNFTSDIQAGEIGGFGFTMAEQRRNLGGKLRGEIAFALGNQQNEVGGTQAYFSTNIPMSP